MFPNLNSFEKHYSRKHAIENLENTVPKKIKLKQIDESHVEINDTTEISNQININNAPVQIDNSFTLECETDFPSTKINIENAINLIYQAGINLTMSLHNNTNFTRKDVVNIQKEFSQSLFKPIADLLKNVVNDLIKDPLLQSSFHTIISAIYTPFKLCNSEYMLDKWLKNNNLYSHINQFTINNEINLVSSLGETNYSEHITKGILMPLQFQFKSYFEHNDNLHSTLTEYERLMSTSDDTVLAHFVQGALWKDKIAPYHTNIVIPYFLYVDDFEVNNPLSSHASCHSICAIYYSFPLSDQSKLCNIFIAALLKSVDMKQFGNDLCLQTLIHELNKLEVDGIFISTKEGLKKVHFVLGLLVGDNLGLNTILEFSKSFSANYFCRFCKENKSVTQKASEENVLLLRNSENYTEDISTNDFKLTGIYKEPIFNQLISFHATTNFSIDLMHDIFEGICHYNLCHIIKYYTETVHIFSLDTLNLRKQNFNYGCIEIGNISPPIKINNIKQFHLKMTAREMMTFVHFFSLMIGDLIPDDDPVWMFFLHFSEIITILLSYQIKESSIIRLEQLIKYHNLNYILLFQDTLKHKHHILLHYPSIIRKSGPPKHFWCFRFEAKHKDLKTYARNISSRKNITLSLAKKYQYSFAFNILNNNNNKNIEINEIHKISCNNTTFLDRIFGSPSKNLLSYSQVKYKGTKFKTGYFLTNFVDEVCLYEILEIVCNINMLVVFFIVHQIEIDAYCSNLRAYKVNTNKNILYYIPMCIRFHNKWCFL